MAHINLLPWRDAARKEQQKIFVIMLVISSVIAFMLMFGISTYYDKRLEGQQKRTEYINRELAIVDSQIAEIQALEKTKTSLAQRMALIEQLQSSRNLGTQIFSEIARTVPGGIYLTQLEKKNTALLLNGQSESNNRLSHMIRQIEDSKLLTFKNLQSITAGKGESAVLSDFTMQLEVDNLIQTAAKEKQP